MPTPKPPFPAQCGLWGKPTIINNVETWANIPVIIDKGADWFTKIGTADSKEQKFLLLPEKYATQDLLKFQWAQHFVKSFLKSAEELKR